MKTALLALLASVAVSTAQASQVQLGLELSGLEPMKGQHYEGWNIVDGAAQSTGRFSIGKDGGVYLVNAMGKSLKKVGQNGHASFSVDRSHLKATLFVLTIEPNSDTDMGPSDVHVMGGDYSRRQASLSVAHGSSIATDFAAAQGSFILAAPTGGMPNQGVWFLNPGNGQGSLSLPSLPDGWAYEGWIVNTENGGKFSTGVFKDATKADSDNAGPLAGPLKLNFPRVPGQDIVRTPVVLDDGIHAIVVTVEPYPDFDPAPYAIKILMAGVYANAPGMTPMMLNNISDTVPSGQAHLH
ncbi:MAG: hypothetical protein KDD43_03875 [Bdellovibrionales bacterium]|nr:hypothetical protein [Bdellovibrionales bacterium]